MSTVGGQHHAPAALHAGETLYPLYRRPGGPQGRSGGVLKISTPTRFDPQTIHVGASRYTDWAIAALREESKSLDSFFRRFSVITQMVSRWLVQVLSRSGLCEISVGQNGTGTDFLIAITLSHYPYQLQRNSVLIRYSIKTNRYI